MTRKLISLFLATLALLIVLEAASLLTIILLPGSGAAAWLAQCDPVFNLLADLGLRPKAGPELTFRAQPEVKVTFVEGPTWVVVRPGLEVFAEPDFGSEVIGVVEKSAKLKALEERDGWFWLDFPDGPAWIHPTGYVTTVTRGDNPEQGGGEETAVFERPTVIESGLKDMRIEIRVEPDDERRPDFVYFDNEPRSPRPLTFAELSGGNDSTIAATLPREINPARLQLAIVLLGGEAETLEVDQFVIRHRDRAWAGEAEAVLRSLIALYDAQFSGMKSYTARQKPAYVFLLPTLEDYRRFYPQARVGEEARTAGHYEPGIIAIHPDLGPDGEPTRSLAHEAVHHLNRTQMGFPSDDSLIWLEEGLANYFALSEIDSGGSIKLGAIDTRLQGKYKTEMSGSSVRLMLNASPPYSRILMLKEKLRRKPEIGLEHILGSRSESYFYSDDIFFNYNVSWLLVHYLFHGKEGEYRERFLDYINEAVHGRGGMAVFERVMGITVQDLERELRNYAFRL